MKKKKKGYLHAVVSHENLDNSTYGLLIKPRRGATLGVDYQVLKCCQAEAA
jgi:hypothetical protein